MYVRTFGAALALILGTSPVLAGETETDIEADEEIEGTSAPSTTIQQEERNSSTQQESTNSTGSTGVRKSREQSSSTKTQSTTVKPNEDADSSRETDIEVDKEAE
jgi:hypothetical protein